MEGWLSGLKLQFTKLPWRLRHRGFESLPFRHFFLFNFSQDEILPAL
jgi:hypothetical protein